MNKIKIRASRCPDAYALLFNYYDSFLSRLKKASDPDDVNCEAFYEDMHEQAKQLIKTHPNKALIRRSTTNVLNHCKRSLTSQKGNAHILESFKNKISAVLEEIEKNVQKIATYGARAIAQGNRILTMSNDYLVVRTLLEAERQKRRFEVFVLKTDPPGEGLELAELLAKKKIRVTVIPDSQMGICLPNANLVLIGPERLYESGFIHRAGSLPLALTAKKLNIPVYLLADTQIILFERERSIKFYPSDEKEVYKSKNKNIHVMNFYYEKVMFEPIYKVICEDGIFEMKEFNNWFLAE
ncbi:eIF2B alpha/beta/delta subunit family protein [Calditrichota bacterium LG25]